MAAAHPLGLAWDGTHLWVGYQWSSYIQRIDPADCTVVVSIDAPSNVVSGVAWDGSAVWASLEYSGFIYRLDPVTGDVLSQIPSPSPDGEYGSADLAWDGTHLWLADYRLDSLYRIDSSDGTILDTFPMDFNVAGVCYRASDGMLIVSGHDDRIIRTIDPADGVVVATCDAPGARPWGMALVGDQVWVADPDEDLLYDLGSLIDVSNESWTWSQVRAAYR